MTVGSVNPLQISRVVALLDQHLKQSGLRAAVSSDFDELARHKTLLRKGQIVSPLFDPAVTTLACDCAFWMNLHNDDGQIVALQAFRMDKAEPNLADWALGWILGTYLKRSELLVPLENGPSKDSITKKISGRTVYQGEVWIGQDYRGRGLLEEFSRFGVILSHIKWQPNAVWALTRESMAKRGSALRMGYAHSERGFLKWQLLPDGAEATEWISIADSHSLERLVSELESTLPQCQPVRTLTPQ